MMHEEYKQSISEYFDGQISPEEKIKLDGHLKECADCQAYYIELHGLSTVLRKWGNDSLSPDVETKLARSLPGVSGKEDKMNTTYRFNRYTSSAVLTIAVILILTTVNIQTHRSLQGRLKSATDDVSEYRASSMARISDTSQLAKGKEDQLGGTLQYEPYYLSTKYTVDKDESETRLLAQEQSKPAEKAIGGMQASTYSPQTVTSGLKQDRYDDLKQKSYDLAVTGRRNDVDQLAQNNLTSAYPTRIINGVIPPSAPIYPMKEEAVSVMSLRELDSQPAEVREYYYRPYPIPANTEEYKHIYENQFLDAKVNPLSTLSIDVDTASYSNIRRFLTNNQLPPADAVRIEEMVNYFNYNYPDPTWNDRFSITLKSSYCPWNTAHQLVMVGIQGKKLEQKQIPPSNLVFLIDVSGSMYSADKLPLLKEGMKMLVNQLSDNERVAIVVYAGQAGLVLDSTPGSQKQAILQAIDSLQAGGSTAGGAGIKLAYDVAKQNFIQNGNNRVILATDGDFNVGVSGDFELSQLIEQKRNDGVFLTVLGFGQGNIKDNKMETLADKGNGNYFYIDNEAEARKVLVNELGSTIFTIAKDVKIQVEFNPAQVQAYRLIGYENRLLAKQDFNDDTKDAGELGAGHTVTALYEIVPTQEQSVPRIQEKGVDPLVYQKEPAKFWSLGNNDVMTVKLRFKDPQSSSSRLVKRSIAASQMNFNPDEDFRFASAVAEFGLILRNSAWQANSSYDHVLMTASQSLGKDSFGYRQEFLSLVQKAKQLDYRPQQYMPYNSPTPVYENQGQQPQINFK